MARRIDGVFFLIGAVSVIWLAYLIFTQALTSGWSAIWLYVVFWVLIAYIALPRLHRILTNIYVPNYFIGRTRTSDGLLGDPVNLAFLGTEAEIHTAMQDAGWTRADVLTFRSAGRIIRSTLLRHSYPEAPVSPLMLFGRNQDFAYQQEVRGTPSRRHHVRFWKCPEGWLLPGGAKVDWLAAGTYDRSVGFSLFTLQITHKIAANTDIERDHIVKSLLDSDALITATRLTNFATGYHARNGGGDEIETDGDLPVVSVDGVTSAPHPQPVKIAAVRKRPLETLFGGVAVFLRALSPALFLLGVAFDWGAVRDAIDLGSDTSNPASFSDAVLWAAVVYAIVYLIFEGLLGVFVLRGSNWARYIVMGFSVVNIVIAAVEHITTGTTISLTTNLVAVSLDILVLIALSSQAARGYARRSGRR
jgi:hypothetical protein